MIMLNMKMCLENNFSLKCLAISPFGNDHRTTKQRNLPILHRENSNLVYAKCRQVPNVLRIKY